MPISGLKHCAVHMKSNLMFQHYLTFFFPLRNLLSKGLMPYVLRAVYIFVTMVYPLCFYTVVLKYNVTSDETESHLGNVIRDI